MKKTSARLRFLILAGALSTALPALAQTQRRQAPELLQPGAAAMTDRTRYLIGASTPIAAIMPRAPLPGLPVREAFAAPARDFSPSARAPAQAQDLSRLFDGSGAKKSEAWDVSLSFGPTLTQYANTDIRVQSSQITGTFHQAQLGERNSMEFYQIWRTGQHPAQFIDEPSNHFVLTAENKKKKYAVSLVVFHPKMLVVDANNLNQSVGFSGTINGRPTDQNIRINDYFGQWHLTNMFVDISLRLEKIVDVCRGKWGSLSYAPGIGAGAVVSGNTVVYRVPGTLWDLNGYDHNPGLIGTSGTLSNRLTYTAPKGRLSVSVTQSLTASHIKYPFMDGTAEQNVNYQAESLTVGYRLFKLK